MNCTSENFSYHLNRASLLHKGAWVQDPSLNNRIFACKMISSFGYDKLIQITFCLILWMSAIANSAASTQTSDTFTTTYNDISCSNGKTFQSLQKCIDICRITVNKISFFNGSENSSKEVKKVYYKLVDLDPDEYELLPDGSFTTHQFPLTQHSVGTFVLNPSTKVIHLCYPLAEHFINCKKWFIDLDEFELQDKSRALKVIPHKLHLHVGEFYIDQSSPDEWGAITCIIEISHQEKQERKSMGTFFVIAYAVSAICLLFTFILALLIPELNISKNMILLSHIVILAIVYWVLLVQNMLSEITEAGCKCLVWLKQFIMIASFFWLNVQAIDLYLRLANLRGQNDTRNDTKRFICYSIYAWGVPLLISFISLGINFTNVKILHPNLNDFCWFDNNDKLKGFVYFFGPVALILLVNFVLFILTIVKLTITSRNVNNATKNTQKQRFLLYVKLFIVMGLCWITEVISWTAGGKERIWYLFDIINALQGLFIFIIYICKPSYLKRLFYQNEFFPNRLKWWPWKKIQISDQCLKTRRNIKSITGIKLTLYTASDTI